MAVLPGSGGVGGPAEPESWHLPMSIASASVVVILLLLAAVYRYQAKLHKNRAHNFQKDLDCLVAAGEIDPRDAADKCVPREIKRAHVNLITKLGEGNFGEASHTDLTPTPSTTQKCGASSCSA